LCKRSLTGKRRNAYSEHLQESNLYSARNRPNIGAIKARRSEFVKYVQYTYIAWENTKTHSLAKFIQETSIEQTTVGYLGVGR